MIILYENGAMLHDIERSIDRVSKSERIPRRLALQRRRDMIRLWREMRRAVTPEGNQKRQENLRAIRKEKREEKRRLRQ